MPSDASGPKNTTGSSSRIAVASRPYASVGVAGMTVFTPMCANMLYGWSECCAPQAVRQPAAGNRYVTGTLVCPPLIRRNLLAWLVICSKTSSNRNGIWNSITGRRPAMAAPVAKLVKPCSVSGISRMRSGPYFSRKPAVTLVSAKFMSSPSTKTDGSRSISSPSARFSAFKYDSLGMAGHSRSRPETVGVHVFHRVGGIGFRAAHGERHHLVEFAFDVGVDPLALCKWNPSSLDVQRIALLPSGDLVVGPVLQPDLELEGVVAVVAVRVELQQRRPATGPRPLDRFDRGRADHLDILPIHSRRRDAECLATPGDRAGDGRPHRQRGGVLVVLAHVHDRQFPQRREIEAFQ